MACSICVDGFNVWPDRRRRWPITLRLTMWMESSNRIDCESKTIHNNRCSEYDMTCDHKNALDLAKEGKWDQSHELVQEYSDELSCLIHAYLHRIEGDIGNAKYW